MAVGSDSGDDLPDADAPAAEGDDTLSPKAREIKRQIREGRYQVDLSSLAERLLEDDALDDAVDEDKDGDSPTGPAPRNDEQQGGK